MIRDFFFFFFSSRRRHTRLVSDWSSDVCSSDLQQVAASLVGERLEGGVGGETEDDVAGAGVGLDAHQAGAVVLESDAAGARAREKLLDVPLRDTRVARAGGYVDMKRRHLEHGHVNRVALAMA